MKKQKISLIIFDLDGVLVDAKQIHFICLNKAISEVAGGEYVITEKEHISSYDGLKTNAKLHKLSKEKSLPIGLHTRISKIKQEYTIKEFSKIKPDPKITSIIKYLKGEEYQIACCSNSIRKTVYTALTKLEVIQDFDLILSNEDVVNSKPHPEIYWRVMQKLGKLPEQTLIVEDSPVGLLAAYRSNANVVRVDSSKDLSIKKIMNKTIFINNKISTMWESDNLNIIIPMAGAGTRFQQAGYDLPKPLIDVNGRPMIQTVVNNLGMKANYIFIVQKSHNEKYNLKTLLSIISKNCVVVEVDGLTEGAACTTLLAKEFINSKDPLILANSDQFLEWDSVEFMYNMTEQSVDGGIVVFNSVDPKWSFAKINEEGLVEEVAEKNPISDRATVGVYYWKHGSDYVKYAEQMIEKNTRVNNEFYVCPVFNEAIADGKKIKTFNVEKMWGLGTPEDLKYYLENYKP